jgi:hypothetical protein
MTWLQWVDAGTHVAMVLAFYGGIKVIQLEMRRRP